MNIKIYDKLMAFRMDKNLALQLSEQANQEGTNSSEVARKAITKYLREVIK